MYRFLHAKPDVVFKPRSDTTERAVLRVRRKQAKGKQDALLERRRQSSVGMMFECPMVLVDHVRDERMLALIKKLREFAPTAPSQTLRCMLQFGRIEEVTGEFVEAVPHEFLKRQLSAMENTMGWVETLPTWLPHTQQRVKSNVDINTLYTTCKPFVVTRHTASKEVMSVVFRLWHHNLTFPSAMKVSLVIEESFDVHKASAESMRPLCVTNSHVKAFKTDNWAYRLWKHTTGDTIKDAAILHSADAARSSVEVELLNATDYRMDLSDEYVACSILSRGEEMLHDLGQTYNLSIEARPESIF